MQRFRFSLKSILLFFLLLLFPLSQAEENNFFYNSCINPVKKVDSCLNNLGSTINLPDHTLSWIFGTATVIALPIVFYKAYGYLQQYLMDRKPDSYIIKHSDNVVSDIAVTFDAIFHLIEEINNSQIDGNAKIIAKMFFKETILKISPGHYPFLSYKWTIDKAIATITHEQDILNRRIKQIKNRISGNENIRDADNACITILTTINSSLEILYSKLKNLEQEIVNYYEYRNDVMHYDVYFNQVAPLFTN